MSRFGKQGVRCDGCGIFSASVDGNYLLPNGVSVGTISSQGRNCEHDFCDACEAKHAPDYRCSKCKAPIAQSGGQSSSC